MKLIDLKGKTFGGWTVVGNYISKNKMTLWPCRCVCGVEKLVVRGNLTRGISKSCGCLSQGYKTTFKPTHNLRHTKEYEAWVNMKTRTTNPNCANYHDYMGRGIKCCDRWLHSFENFYEDMGKAPHEWYSLDRIDVNGDYEPSNCRWATPTQQVNNRRKFIKTIVMK